MTNEQLYFAVGLPILFNLVFNGVMFLALNARIGGIEARMGGIDARMNNLEVRMTNLEQSNAAKFDLLVGAIHELDNRLSRLEERLERR